MAAQSPPTGSTRPRGRPRKNAVPPAPSSKRPRGRPRKNAVPPPPIKRPRGRPPKSTSAIRKPPLRRGPKPRSDRAIHLLAHAYDTAVSPLINHLSYAGRLDSPATYGEQSPSFIRRILREYGISATSSFVDLGSGVGNVVLQAYLATGCRALGCELDQGRGEAAAQLQREIGTCLDMPPVDINVRAMGGAEELRDRVVLRRGDFFKDWVTTARIHTADLIFCGNVKFGPEIVGRQADAVLAPMKAGAVFVSLERVVRGSRAKCRQTLAGLGVTEERRLSERGDVSWTDRPVEYWVYKK